MTIATIGVRELRNGLSRHLTSVQGGLEITVTDHGHPVARITPIVSESGLEALLNEGIAQPPASPRSPLPTRVATKATVSDLIGEQRR